MPFVENPVLVTEIECWNKEGILNRGASGFYELINCISVQMSEISSGRGKADLRTDMCGEFLQLVSFCFPLKHIQHDFLIIQCISENKMYLMVHHIL